MDPVQIIGHQRSKCEGCRWLYTPKPGKRAEGASPHCSNPRSIWYMRHATCRCDLKEFDDEEEFT